MSGKSVSREHLANESVRLVRHRLDVLLHREITRIAGSLCPEGLALKKLDSVSAKHDSDAVYEAQTVLLKSTAMMRSEALAMLAALQVLKDAAACLQNMIVSNTAVMKLAHRPAGYTDTLEQDALSTVLMKMELEGELNK